jgi:hypothetical protein
MTFADVVVFGQEWGALIALFLLVLLVLAADLFPRIAAFIAEIEAVFPGLYDHLEAKEQALVNRYDRLPARIRAGFALVGGKTAWAALVRWMYKFVRDRAKRS